MFGGISIWQLLIILVVVILIFGTKKLRTLGSDLGGAVKGFKKAVNEEENKPAEKLEDKTADAQFSEQKDSAKKDETK